MAGTDDAAPLETSSDSNVVQRAVEKLSAAFASRGFGEKTSQRKMEAAADMLMNGLSDKGVDGADPDYASLERPVSVVLEDIRVAERHVEQARKAAEIYFDVAPARRDLSDELQSLQAALLVSDRALLEFRNSLPTDRAADVDRLQLAVDGLRDITNRFGDRVRTKRLNEKTGTADRSVS